ncbi:MAG: hypothetical protein MUD02_10900, partial [Bacteroidales bacterium]|nr:hypothetical protein [Bacteroidales bacterium]
NQVTAFSRVHIEQGDTLDLYGDYLFYDGKNEDALVRGNVELIDKETHLYTDEVRYDVKNRIARYNNRGRITNADNTLTSIIGVYYVSDNLFHFKDSVKIVNPDYVMTADTMDYNTETEIAFFTGPSELEGDSIYLYCEKGWYDTKNEKTAIWKNALIDNREQIIKGDSLLFDDLAGFGESFGNIEIIDTTNNLMLKGNYAWYYKAPERFMVTDRAVYIQSSGSDSLFMHADTISAMTLADTTGKAYRLMRAFHGVRIWSLDMQAKCDSLAYSFRDSVIRLYNEPVIWSEENQLTADSMAVFTRNTQAERLELYNTAFVASQVDTFRFNQLKGRDLTGWFRDNELYRIDIRGNAESVYYLMDGDLITGLNPARCARIEVFLEDGKIVEVTEYENAEGTLEPPDVPSPGVVRLKGFNWLQNIRPAGRNDIFRR